MKRYKHEYMNIQRDIFIEKIIKIYAYICTHLHIKRSTHTHPYEQANFWSDWADLREALIWSKRGFMFTFYKFISASTACLYLVWCNIHIWYYYIFDFGLFVKCDLALLTILLTSFMIKQNLLLLILLFLNKYF